MASSEQRRWSLVLDVAGITSTFTVRGATDAAVVMEAVKGRIGDLMRAGGCRSLVIGVHVEGAACDHVTGGG
jgi:hypothetical protein